MPGKIRNQRLFIAISIPPDAEDSLLRLNSFFPSVRFAKKFHLTLTFIGDAFPAEKCAKVLRNVEEEAFCLELSHMGVFTQGILWYAPKPNKPLLKLKAAIDDELAPIGYIPESRKYFPHITLCRTKAAIAPQILAAANATRLNNAWQVSSFGLYQSQLTPQGAIHTLIEEYPLLQGGGRLSN